ncbi:MAG: hypothetical protein Q4G71_17945 [Pseudomonadota bacterium]|nr:hypothetical protein [Pseudomonadota bacterium]
MPNEQSRLVLASRHARAFQRALQQRLGARLADMAAPVKQLEGFGLGDEVPSRPQAKSRDIKAADWDKLEAMAVDVSGPVGTLLIQQIKSQMPVATSLALAVETIAHELGEQGDPFRQLAKRLTG